MTETGHVQAEAGLKKSVGLIGVVAVGLGTAVGVSIFSVIAPSSAVAGPGMLIAMVIAMVPMMIFGILYAFMGAAVPVSGASYEWPRRYVHPFIGFIVSWLRISGSTAAMIVLSVVLVGYLGTVVDVPTKPAMFIMFLMVFVLNLVGVSAAAKGQAVMFVILLITCGVFVAGSADDISVDNLTPVMPFGLTGVLAAVPLLISLFLGIESAVEIGGEVKNPGRNIPLGIAISVVLTTALYFAVSLAAIGVVGAETLGASNAPLLDAARLSLSKWGQPVILVSALVAIGTSLNATFLIFTRFLYAMGQSGVLPSVLGRVHPRFGTPHVATMTAFGLCCAGLLLPSNLIFLFLAVNIPTLMKYGAVSLAAARLPKQDPEAFAASPVSLSAGALHGLAIAGLLAALVILVLGFSADWRPYALLGSWLGVGIIYYGVRMLFRRR